MSIKRIDARGLSCPQPVLLAQKAIEEGQVSLEVIVDNETARENIFRLLKKSGLSAETKNMETDILISVAQQEPAAATK